MDKTFGTFSRLYHRSVAVGLDFSLTQGTAVSINFFSFLLKMLISSVYFRRATIVRTLLTSSAASSIVESTEHKSDVSSSGRTESSVAPPSQIRLQGVDGRVKPDLVQKFLGLELANESGRMKQERQRIISEFQRHSHDVGSPEVIVGAVALWTQRIRDLAYNFQSYRSTVHRMSDMELLFNQRRDMLIYLRKKDFKAYCLLLHKLGLKDVFTDVHGEDRYPEGIVHGQAVDDRVTRFLFAFHTLFNKKKPSQWKRIKPKLMREVFDNDGYLRTLRILL
ncbi:hypothetical protein CEUSTIGMA_g3294.t1 [Chlamydomonas eustigma]|uniref:Small ribosomal subunit protein uS15c n=1 Tax=Chlamydomonas eustigma TaxID=1157962 RepID=A0A250WYE7_9CHLO|nr:hypothetical protein CEUSTIGMA_g3294.t1 [Chlamydomonas eustigma]|eukprot:GAX75851.1 hypothetical protein CEUSTIGMA_g3294.t1 [Chlamydomonas eustigma]